MNFGFLKKYAVVILCCAFNFSVLSQQSVIETGIVSEFNNALKLYNSKAYAAAQKTFEKVQKQALANSSLQADASYYDAMCAIKLNQTNADEKVLSFVEEYPTNNKKDKAFFNVGNYYFANKKAAYALKWYTKVNTDALSNQNRKELNFKMGYGLLVAKKLNLAKARFLPLINDAKYGNDARYYYGFIAYKLEDYGIAESTLKEIADNESYKAEISYYLLDISFKAAKFERCVIVGQKLLQTARKRDISEISKIIGESYFNLQKYNEAIPFLEAYTGKNGKWNNTDYYQLGYAYYQQNNFETAINYFNKIIDQKNAVSQNAYYHLAECYLNLDKKNEALNAFKTASQMPFNSVIQEDASLNYAKLSYEEGNPFESVSDVLQAYLKKYPNSKSYDEINQLVVSSFIHQQDYEGALAYLKKKSTAQNQALSYEVSLYRAIQLFNANQFKEALPFFTNAKKSSENKIKQKARFWEAETYYQLENFEIALQNFIAFKNNKSVEKSNYPLLDYNTAYCYFKLKKYTEAINFYRNFINQTNRDSAIKNDAYVRLGDSYFANSNYTDAIKSYKNVLDEASVGADYAQYQIGMSYGFKEESDAKIQALTNVINNYTVSNLKDDALYELANTYTKIKKNKKAHQAYNRLMKNHPKSVFLPKALVRQGLLYYNDNQNAKALETYKLVAQQFPNSASAFEAVNNAKNIYVDEDRLDAYVAWTKTLTFVDISDSELENSAFTIAERKYFENNSNSSILGLKKYLRSFPNGKNKLKASYYLAAILFKEELYDQAIPQLKAVLEVGQSDFSEDVLAKLSQIYLQKEAYQEAIPFLKQLEQEAYRSENIRFAQNNLMQSYYKIDNYDLAASYAKKVVSKAKSDSNLALDAKTIIARTSFISGDFETAKQYYIEIEKVAAGELKAEALYYDAFFKNQEKEYQSSNKTVQKLIANYAAYKYWGVKSYVIMAKNYYSLEDAYQATFILENVVKNFSQFEEIVTEAKTILTKIKENEAKTNNSISTQNKN